MSALTDADRAFYLLLITVCISICLVWALWEMDQKRERRERTQTEDQRIEARARSAVSPAVHRVVSDGGVALTHQPAPKSSLLKETL
jgi:hypothetical protein